MLNSLGGYLEGLKEDRHEAMNELLFPIASNEAINIMTQEELNESRQEIMSDLFLDVAGDAASNVMIQEGFDEISDDAMSELFLDVAGDSLNDSDQSTDSIDQETES